MKTQIHLFSYYGEQPMSAHTGSRALLEDVLSHVIIDINYGLIELFLRYSLIIASVRRFCGTN